MFYELCMALSLPLEIRYGFRRCGLRRCVWVSSWQRMDCDNLDCQLGLRNTEDICKVHFCCACEDISRNIKWGALLWMLWCHTIVWEPIWNKKARRRKHRSALFLLAGVHEVSNFAVLCCPACRTTAMEWIDYGLKPETLMDKTSFILLFCSVRHWSVMKG